MPLDPSLDPLFESAGQQYNVDPNLLRAVALTESRGKLNSASPAGAQGLMQFMPETAAQYGVKNPNDPAQAIPGAAHLLSDLLNTYEGQVGPGPQAVTMALKGYNAGSPSRWNNPETIAYPGAVANYYVQLTKPQGRPGQQPTEPETAALLNGQKGPITDNGYPFENLGNRATPALPPNTTNYAPTGPGDPGGHIDVATGQHIGPQLAAAPTTTMSDALPDYGLRPPNAGPIPPQIPRNSRGEPYQPLGPNEAVAAGTPGAGPVITAQQAAAASIGGGNRLPVMPSNYVFGNGKVAPPGAGTVSPMDSGVAALAAAGTPAGNAPTQIAQAQPQGMSDEDILNGFVNGTLPMFKNAGAPAAQAQQAPAMPAAAPAPNLVQGGASAYTPADVARASQIVQHYTALGLTPPADAVEISKIPALAAAAWATEFAHQMLVPGPNGYVSAPGVDSTLAGRKAADTAAGQLSTINNGQVAPLPGAVQTTQTMANAKAEGEGQAQRVTQAVAPQSFRGAGSGTFYPPGSPVAPSILEVGKSGQAPEGAEVKPVGNSGGVTIENTNPSSETIGHNFEALGKMADTADAARLTKYQAGLLKDRLNAIGTSGPLTEHLGELAALAKQAGVPDDVLKATNIPDAPTVQQANAISLELLGSILHQTFPSRITNSDIVTFKPSNPGVNMLSDASNYLIDKIVVPKADRDIQRYGFATTLPQNDTQAFKKKLFDWDDAHPYENFVTQPQAGVAPGAAAARGAAPTYDRAALEAEMKRRGLLPK